MNSPLADAYASLEAVKRRAEWLEASIGILRAVLESRPPVANMNTPGYIQFDQRCKAALRHIEERGRGV